MKERYNRKKVKYKINATKIDVKIKCLNKQKQKDSQSHIGD